MAIPGSVTSIEVGAFASCTSLTSVTIPNSVTSILNFTFSGCTSLTNVTIPDSVTNIWLNAFSSCSSLTSVTIGSSVTFIQEGVFQNCTSLTNLTFLGNAPLIGWFDNVSAGASVYYYYGTTGWGPTFVGLPTVMLGAPAPQITTASVSVRPGSFSFTLTGVTNQTIVVEASADLVNWQPLWTNTLSGASADFVDQQWSSYPHRFYRASTP